MKQAFYIIGMGLGYDSLTKEALHAIDQSSIIIFTSQRLCASFENHGVKKENQHFFVTYNEEEINALLEEWNTKTAVSLIVSGDVGFHSIASKYQRSDAIFITGITSYAALAAHFHFDYTNLATASIHGLDQRRAIATIRRNKQTFILLPRTIAPFVSLLILYGFSSCTCYIGCDMGGAHQSFTKGRVDEIKEEESSLLRCMIIENPHFDARVKSGLNDDFFLRSQSIPMTKKAVRTMVIALLDISPTDVIWDIGCGSGSITVEAGLAAYDGWVYGIDCEKEAVEITKQNLIKAKIANAEVCCDKAPQGLSSFEKPDALFIGGSKGCLHEIITTALQRNPQVRIVVTAISLDTVAEALSMPIDWEIMQMQASFSHQRGKHHLMKGENPIYILSFGGRNA